METEEIGYIFYDISKHPQDYVDRVMKPIGACLQQEADKKGYTLSHLSKEFRPKPTGYMWQCSLEPVVVAYGTKG